MAKSTFRGDRLQSVRELRRMSRAQLTDGLNKYFPHAANKFTEEIIRSFEEGDYLLPYRASCADALVVLLDVNKEWLFDFSDAGPIPFPERYEAVMATKEKYK